MLRRVTLVAFVITAFLATAHAAPPQLVAAGQNPNPITVQPNRAPGDPVNLVLDDGSAENNIGIGGTSEFIFLNRFSPVEFPIELTNVLVYFESGLNMTVGDPYDVYMWANTTGNTDPAVGATYVGGQTGNTIGLLDDWNDVTLGTPLQFAGPNDVAVGVIHRVIPGSSVYPAALDQTATQQRSWAGWYTTPNAPNPPTLPPDSNWTLIDAYFPGNWMVRATGTVVPVELQYFSAE